MKTPYIFILLLLIILGIASAFCFRHELEKISPFNNKNIIESKSSNTSEKNTGANISTNQSNNLTQTTAKNENGSAVKIPILMYHYIRDFNDPNDKIGINLSVSPSNFSNELDKIQKAGYETITFRDILSKSIPAKPIILTFDDGYEDFYQNALPVLKSHQMKAVSFVIFEKQGGDYMTANQIKELESDGVEVGSHTLSHPDLTTVSQDKAKTEIGESKTKLENLIGKTIISFCYPSGKVNDAVEKITKDDGYLFATTTKSGIADFTSDKLLLNRYRMNPDTNISAYLK